MPLTLLCPFGTGTVVDGQIESFDIKLRAYTMVFFEEKSAIYS